MKRLLLAVLLLSTLPALARDNRLPDHPIVMDQDELRKQLEDLDKLIDRMAKANRSRARYKLADDARSELNDLRRMVNDARQPGYYLDRDRSDRDHDHYDHRNDGPNAQMPPAPPVTLPANYVPPPSNTLPPPPPGQSTQPVVYPINQPSFNQLTAAIQREALPRNRLRVLSSAAPGNWFLVAQAELLLRQFQFSADRLQAMRVLKPRLLDTANFYKLYGSFEFAKDKAELKRILEHR